MVQTKIALLSCIGSASAAATAQCSAGVTPGQDCSDPDITFVTAYSTDDCCNACAAQPGCGAFVFVGGQGDYAQQALIGGSRRRSKAPNRCYLKYSCSPTGGCDQCTAGTVAPPCTATSADGDWVAHEVIQAQVTYGLQHGTAKSHAESKTQSWSKSVTKTVSGGFSFAKVTASKTIGSGTSQTYSDEWSANTEVSYSVTFPAEDAGLQLWQYVINIEDSCGHTEQTKTTDYALTAGRYQKPCCPAGYGGPGHTIDYQVCHAPATKASWCSTTAEYFTAV